MGVERDATVIAATHSAAFVMGCVTSGADTTIVRLTYEARTGAATARQLTTAELRPLMQDPLLRSARALDGLFHRAVIVGESDADRAFYDEINRRLSEESRGIADAQFVNAQNWQTVPRICGPLRKLGVPAVAVLDMDAVWGTGSVWARIYEAAGLAPTDPEYLRLDTERRAVALAADRALAKSGGVIAVPSARRARLRRHVDDLAKYGIFVVPVGELEQWLPGVGATGTTKSQWIVSILGRLGRKPAPPHMSQRAPTTCGRSSTGSRAGWLTRIARGFLSSRATQI